MNIALSVYPLSSGYKAIVSRRFADVDYLTLVELRQQKLGDLWNSLRAIRAEKIIIPIEDTQSMGHLPILKCIAAASRGKTIELLHDPETHGQEITRGEAGLSMFAVVSETVRALKCLAGCSAELKRLMRDELIQTTPKGTRGVLFINPNLWFGVKAGGSVGHIAGVANGLVHAGFQVDYVAASSNRLLDSNVDHVALNPLKTFAFPYELNRFRFHRYVTSTANKLMHGDRHALIYQRHALGNYSGALLSRAYKIPLILEYNSSEVWVAQHWGETLHFQKAFGDAENVCLKHAHLVVTVSSVLQKELIDRGVPSERIVCYPNCVDPRIHNPNLITREQVQRIKVKHSIPEDAVVVGFVGTFGPWHGIEVLARSIQALVETHGEFLAARRVRFLLVGDGPRMRDVRSLIDAETCRRFATLTGLIPQEEATAYLAACDVLVSPHIANADGTRFFGSPTKLFEYMAMGKAIIASRLEQIGDVLANSLTAANLPIHDPAGTESELAVLSAPGNVGELTRSLLFLTDKPAWRAILGKNARKEATSKYTWDKHTSMILSRLKDMDLLRGWSQCH